MQTAAALSELKAEDAISLQMPLLMAYQSVAQSLTSVLRTPKTGQMSGGYLSKHKGRGMEFDEARHYQPGDDIRAIDWRVTARTGKAHTKVFREERERPVFLLCDVSASMQFGSSLQLKSVLAGHLMAFLAWQAKHRGDRVGGLVFNSLAHHEIKPANRTTTLLHLLQQTCLLQQAQPLQIDPNRDALADSLKRLSYLAKPGSQINLISDFNHIDKLTKGLLQQLRRRCEVRCFVIRDPFESTTLAEPIQLTVTDGYTTAERTFGLDSNPATSEDVTLILQQLGLAVFSLDASQTLVHQLNHSPELRGVV